MNCGVVGDRGAYRVPRSAINEELVAKGEDMAFGIETDLNLV